MKINQPASPSIQKSKMHKNLKVKNENETIEYHKLHITFFIKTIRN